MEIEKIREIKEMLNDYLFKKITSPYLFSPLIPNYRM